MKSGIISINPDSCRKQGFTFVETMLAVAIISIVMLGSVALMMGSTRNTDKSQTQNKVNTDVALAVEKVSALLDEARSITIDANGLGITYYYPAAAGSAVYTASATATDTVQHRLYVSNGQLLCSDNVNVPILLNVPAKDPVSGAALVMFSSGVNNSEIVLRLASDKTTSMNVTLFSAVTAHIRPRNM